MAYRVDSSCPNSDQAAAVVDAYTDLSETYERTRLSAYMQLVEEVERRITAEEARTIDANRILEISCGTGRFSEFLAHTDNRVYALDITPAMLHTAQQFQGHIGYVSWTNESAEALPFVDSSFDLVVALKVLPHVMDLAAALGDVARVLQDQGRAVLDFYNPCSLGSITGRYDLFIGWLAPRQVEDWIERCGLRVVRHQGVRTVTLCGGIHRGVSDRQYLGTTGVPTVQLSAIQVRLLLRRNRRA